MPVHFLIDLPIFFSIFSGHTKKIIDTSKLWETLTKIVIFYCKRHIAKFVGLTSDLTRVSTKRHIEIYKYTVSL